VGRYALLPAVLDALDAVSARLQSDQRCWADFRRRALSLLEPHVADITLRAGAGAGGASPGRRRLAQQDGTEADAGGLAAAQGGAGSTGDGPEAEGSAPAGGPAPGGGGGGGWLSFSAQDTFSDRLVAGRLLHRAAQLNSSAAGAFLCGLYASANASNSSSGGREQQKQQEGASRGGAPPADLLDAAYIAAVAQPAGCALAQSPRQVWRAMHACWQGSSDLATARRCKMALAHAIRPPALLNQTLSWLLGVSNASVGGSGSGGAGAAARLLEPAERLAMVKTLARNSQYVHPRNPQRDPNFVLSFLYAYWRQVAAVLGGGQAQRVLEEAAAGAVNTAEQWLALKQFAEEQVPCTFQRQRLLSRAGCGVRCSVRVALPLCALL
jgi:hypothetical protein